MQLNLKVGRWRTRILLVPADSEETATTGMGLGDAMPRYRQAVGLWSSGKYDYVVVSGTGARSKNGSVAARVAYCLEQSGIATERIIVVIDPTERESRDDEHHLLGSERVASADEIALVDRVIEDLRHRGVNGRLRITVLAELREAYGLWHGFRHLHGMAVQCQPLQEFTWIAPFSGVAMVIFRFFDGAARRKQLWEEIAEGPQELGDAMSTIGRQPKEEKEATEAA